MADTVHADPCEWWDGTRDDFFAGESHGWSLRPGATVERLPVRVIGAAEKRGGWLWTEVGDLHGSVRLCCSSVQARVLRRGSAVALTGKVLSDGSGGVYVCLPPGEPHACVALAEDDLPVTVPPAVPAARVVRQLYGAVLVSRNSCALVAGTVPAGAPRAEESPEATAARVLCEALQISAADFVLMPQLGTVTTARSGLLVHCFIAHAERPLDTARCSWATLDEAVRGAAPADRTALSDVARRLTGGRAAGAVPARMQFGTAAAHPTGAGKALAAQPMQDCLSAAAGIVAGLAQRAGRPVAARAPAPPSQEPERDPAHDLCVKCLTRQGYAWMLSLGRADGHRIASAPQTHSVIHRAQCQSIESELIVSQWTLSVPSDVGDLPGVDLPRRRRVWRSVHFVRPGDPASGAVQSIVAARELLASGGIASASSVVEVPYVRLMSAAVGLLRPSAALCLGGGAGSLPMLLGDTLDGAAVDVVEVEPAMVDAAKRFLGYGGPRVTTHTQDAVEYLRGCAEGSYDAVFVDVFVGASAPEHVGAETAVDGFAALLRRCLRQPGVGCCNVPHTAGEPQRTLLAWRRAFGDENVAQLRVNAAQSVLLATCGLPMPPPDGVAAAARGVASECGWAFDPCASSE